MTTIVDGNITFNVSDVDPTNPTQVNDCWYQNYGSGHPDVVVSGWASEYGSIGDIDIHFREYLIDKFKMSRDVWEESNGSEFYPEVLFEHDGQLKPGVSFNNLPCKFAFDWTDANGNDLSGISTFTGSYKWLIDPAGLAGPYCVLVIDPETVKLELK